MRNSILTNVSQPSMWGIKNIVCLIPVVSLAIAYFAYSFFYSAFIDIKEDSKPILPTGLTSAEVMIGKSESLTETDIVVLNNRAFAARSTWSVFAFLHVFVCVVALFLGVYLILAATNRFSHWLPIGVLVFYSLYIASQLFNFNLSGNYRIFNQLLAKTIQIAQYSGFPEILRYSIFLNKISFFVAALLAVAGGMTLIEGPKDKDDLNLLAKCLREEMRLLQNTLYIGTIVLISAILLLSFTLRWALIYIYPWDGPINQSIESLVSAIMISSGVYYSVLLGLSYIPIAAIQHYRASKLVEREEPSVSVDKQSNWLKENGLSISPIELLPRIVAILGPILAGSITDLIRVIPS